MEQCTLDAIGVLIISTAAGGGVLGLKTWYLVFQVQVHLSYASVYLDLDSGYLSGVGQVHLPPLWYLYYNSQGVRQAIIIVIVMTLSPRNYDKAFRQYFLLTPKM